MNRRELLAVGALVAVAGCTDSEGDTDPEPEPQQDDADGGDDDSVDDTPEADTDLEILNVEVPSSVEQGAELGVDVTINTVNGAGISADLLDGDGESLATDRAETSTDGGQTVSLSLSVGDDATVGNGELVVTAEYEPESLSDEWTTEIEIVEVLSRLDRWEQQIRDHINGFLTNFAEIGSDNADATILQTDVTDGYRSAQATGPLFDADSRLSDARSETSPGSSEREIFSRLQDEVDFLRQLSDTQQAACEVFDELVEVQDLFKNDRSLRSDYDEKLADAEDELDELSDLLDEFDPVVSDLYDEKIEQIDAELSIIDDTIRGISPIFTARDDFDDGLYGLAFDRAQSARRDFESVVDDLEQEDQYPPTDEINTEFLEHVETWADEADEIERESSGRRTDDE